MGAAGVRRAGRATARRTCGRGRRWRCTRPIRADLIRVRVGSPTIKRTRPRLSGPTCSARPRMSDMRLDHLSYAAGPDGLASTAAAPRRAARARLHRRWRAPAVRHAQHDPAARRRDLPRDRRGARPPRVRQGAVRPGRPGPLRARRRLARLGRRGRRHHRRSSSASAARPSPATGTAPTAPSSRGSRSASTA